MAAGIELGLHHGFEVDGMSLAQCNKRIEFIAVANHDENGSLHFGNAAALDDCVNDRVQEVLNFPLTQVMEARR